MSTGVMARQSTAVTLDVGPILDSTGAEYTSAVIADLTLSKNGTRAAMSGNTFTHAGNGHYSLTLTTTNTDTLGVIQISCNKSTYQMPVKERQIVPANVFDSIVLGSDYLQIDAIQIGGDAQSATDLKDFADAGYDPSTNALTGAVELDPAIETAIESAASDAATLVSRITSGRAANLDNLDVAVSVIQSQITALNNLSAKANWFGSLLLEVPDSGTREYVFELVVKDDEDKLVNLDGSPTIALVNAAGTDRSSLITTAIANPSTGRYTLTVTVGTGTVNESLKLTASGTVSAEARYAVIAPQVVDYDNATQVALLLTRLGTPSVSVSADIAAVSTKLGTPAGASVSADIASIKTDTGTTIPGLFTTLTTKIRKFFQLGYRKDAAIATDNATELTELNADGGSGPGAYSNITEAQEAIRDRGDAAWTTGGGGGGDTATLMLSTTIATVTSQTVLILTAGTAENDAYKDMLVIVTDQVTATQKSRAMVASYVGSTKTLTLSAAFTFTVAVGDTIDIVAVSGRTTEFTGSALTKLNTIQSSVVMQTGATGYSVVRPGGKIVLKAGDDYSDDLVTTVSLPVTDADEVVYDRLTDATTSVIKFAAGRNRQKDLIVGTVTKANVTKSAGVTYVPIQIARSQITSAKVFSDYKYDIQVTTSGGKVTTPVGGELEVEFDNAD